MSTSCRSSRDLLGIFSSTSVMIVELEGSTSRAKLVVVWRSPERRPSQVACSRTRTHDVPAWCVHPWQMTRLPTLPCGMIHIANRGIARMRGLDESGHFHVVEFDLAPQILRSKRERHAGLRCKATAPSPSLLVLPGFQLYRRLTATRSALMGHFIGVLRNAGCRMWKS